MPRITARLVPSLTSAQKLFIVVMKLIIYSIRVSKTKLISIRQILDCWTCITAQLVPSPGLFTVWLQSIPSRMLSQMSLLDSRSQQCGVRSNVWSGFQHEKKWLVSDMIFQRLLWLSIQARIEGGGTEPKTAQYSRIVPASASFLAELSVRPPRKFIIFLI